MSKLACALAISLLLVLCTPSLSDEIDFISSEALEAQSQVQLLETQVAQIALSEKELGDIIALQQAGGPLTDQETKDLAQLEELQKQQLKGMLKDEDFDFPLQLLQRHKSTKCNAQIIQAVLVIIRTAKMQV